MKAHTRLVLLFSCVGVAATAACGGSKEATPDTAAVAQTATPAGGPQTPDAGGKVIPIEVVTDDKGNNKFTPNNFEAKKGDVLRFTLVQGVHNIHFLPDSNPGVQGLPAASQMLQIAGQTEDVKVAWAPGTYYFQCDPHALLGMVGHVTVK
jgi:plastocyanin